MTQKSISYLVKTKALGSVATKITRLNAGILKPTIMKYTQPIQDLSRVRNKC